MYKLLNNVPFYNVTETNKAIEAAVAVEMERALAAEQVLHNIILEERSRALVAEELLQTEIDNIGSMEYEDVTDASFDLKVGKPKSYTGTASQVTVTLDADNIATGMWYKLMFSAPDNFETLTVVPPEGYTISGTPTLEAGDIAQLTWTVASSNKIICQNTLADDSVADERARAMTAEANLQEQINNFDLAASASDVRDAFFGGEHE
jgi:hypothetical protein